MKNIKLSSLLLLLISIVFAACDNADYKPIKNSIYIGEAAGNIKSRTLTMDQGVEIPINIRLARKVDQDVSVRIDLNDNIIENFNKNNNSEYYPIPNFKMPEDAEVIIPAGEIGAIYSLKVEDFETEGKQYALGVELSPMLDSNINISSTQGQFLYVLSKPLNVSVPILKGVSGKINAAPEENWGITTPEWSLEFWTNMSAYSRNNQAVFNAGSSDHEIYIRFGDANRPYNYLQVKTLGGQIQTASDLDAGKWYHWALVYDGTTLTLYRNGEPDVKFNPPSPKGDAVRFDYLEMISSGTYFTDKCMLSQVRLWKTAISQTQIKNNMYFSVNSKNPELIGYWPMSEGSGVDFKDITGNGHDAKADDGVVLGWEHNIRFDK